MSSADQITPAAPRMRSRCLAEGGGRPEISGTLTSLSLAALGVVFGDIGTSPLYTLKTVLNLAGDRPDSFTVLGSLSLVIWTLIIITSIKYVNVAMRIDNDGEGGILALMSLLGVKGRKRPAIVAIGLFGAALIYGDGAITPAISVLSALEGLKMVAPAFNAYVLPAAVAVLIGLFAIQPQGTARIGNAFGPIMALWFLVIGALGVWGIAQHPAVLWALDPRHAIEYLFSGGATSFLVLGGVFLCVTGAEALYADMGHFGPRPIRLAWSALVFPCLVLNYAGQGAHRARRSPDRGQYFLSPLSARAAGAHGGARHDRHHHRQPVDHHRRVLHDAPGHPARLDAAAADQTDLLLRLRSDLRGPVNWLLMIVTLGLTIGFGKSDNLAAAYGIAVSATMLMTSALLFIAMREIWHWSLLAAGAVAGAFFIVDAGFVAANFTQDHRGRLCAAAAGRGGVRRDVDLA